MENEQIYEGYYIGRELGGEGFKKNGVTPWKKYVIKFKPRGQQQFGFTIGVFVPIPDQTSLQLEQLVENKYYKVTYYDGAINPKNNRPFKQFLKILEAVPSAVPAPMATPQQQLPVQPQVLDLTQFQSFRAVYFETCDKNNLKPNISHMVGSFLRSFEKQRTQGLVNMATVSVQFYEREKQKEAVQANAVTQVTPPKTETEDIVVD